MYQFDLESLARAHAYLGLMWPYVIVLFEPHVDDDLGLIDACEPFRIEDFMT